LQYHREGGDVEGNHRKKHEKRIWQQLVHGKEISLDIRKEGTAKLYPQSPFSMGHGQTFQPINKHAALRRRRNVGAVPDSYFLWSLGIGSGVFIMLPVANPTMAIPTKTQTIPIAWPNTNPPSSHKIAATITDNTSVRVLESMMNLSFIVFAQACHFVDPV
jgi:hypothetical protein